MLIAELLTLLTAINVDVGNCPHSDTKDNIYSENPMVHTPLLSAILSFSAPSGAPTDVVASVQSESSIDIWWSPPELFKQNGPITGYSVSLTYGNETRSVYNVSGNTLYVNATGRALLNH